MGFTQYLKDTRSELHHVAWPTRNETIIYTILVAAISIFVALYLGLFDFIFTTGLSKALIISGNTPAPSASAQVGTTTTPDVTISTSSPTTIPVTNSQQ